jgi:hypothetical protein
VNPGRYNINVYQGTTFQLSPAWKIDNLAVDITGYNADMQVRQFTDSTTLLAQANIANGKIVLTAAQGIINITLPASETAGYAAGNYLYDLNLTAPDGITVYKLLTGNFTVSASVIH